MKVEALAAGDADGINSVLRYVWQGRLPYRMVFDLRATRRDPQVAIEAQSRAISKALAAGVSLTRDRSARCATNGMSTAPDGG